MHQLSSLDAQFLGLESSKVYGHVGGLLIFDPSTAPNGKFGVDDVSGLIAERVHLVPPFRWRLVQVPLNLNYPYWSEDPDFDLAFHVRDRRATPETIGSLLRQWGGSGAGRWTGRVRCGRYMSSRACRTLAWRS